MVNGGSRSHTLVCDKCFQGNTDCPSTLLVLSCFQSRLRSLYYLCHQVSAPSLPECFCHINTPLKHGAWKEALAGHPDKSYIDYILHGIVNGFRIGFDYSCHTCSPLSGDLLSTLDNPGVVEDYLQKELSDRNISCRLLS